MRVAVGLIRPLRPRLVLAADTLRAVRWTLHDSKLQFAGCRRGAAAGAAPMKMKRWAYMLACIAFVDLVVFLATYETHGLLLVVWTPAVMVVAAAYAFAIADKPPR